MSVPSELTQFLHANLDGTILFLIALLVIVSIVLAVVLAKLAKLHRLYSRLTRGTSGGNVEEILVGYMSKVQELDSKVSVVASRVDSLAENQLGCIQHVGVVRYDAFEDVGGEQSYAIVMTDAHKNGVALTSVYSRTEARTYAKSLTRGKASHTLTAEELRALKVSEKGFK